jgi:hypothetical protein
MRRNLQRGGVPDDSGILDRIRLLMNVGVLPVGEITAQRIGVGSTSMTCDACNQPIPAGAAIELEFWTTIGAAVHSMT